MRQSIDSDAPMGDILDLEVPNTKRSELRLSLWLVLASVVWKMPYWLMKESVADPRREGKREESGGEEEVALTMARFLDNLGSGQTLWVLA
jgi:hypothetical protein